jgi:hypothetical protein
MVITVTQALQATYGPKSNEVHMCEDCACRVENALNDAGLNEDNRTLKS